MKNSEKSRGRGREKEKLLASLGRTNGQKERSSDRKS
jgi:hypothetical protein